MLPLQPMRQNKTVAVWTNLVFLSHRNSPKALLKMSMLSLDFSEHLRADADFASEVVGPVDILGLRVSVVSCRTWVLKVTGERQFIRH